MRLSPALWRARASAAWALAALGLGWASVVALAAAAAEPATLVAVPPGAKSAPLTAHLRVGAALGELPRVGINLGSRNSWGAEQLMANVLRNPGLEAPWDGALLVLGAADHRVVVDDSPWTARADGFWTGAAYTVLSGAAVGASGQVLGDRLSPQALQGQSRPATAFTLDPMPAGLKPGDVLALAGTPDTQALPLWWSQGRLRPQPGDIRPGSPGLQSVRLVSVPGSPAALIHYLDMLGARAGKLLPVHGPWRLSLWARADSPGARLHLEFGRQGQPPWVRRDWQPGSQWTPLVIDFDAQDDGPPGPLQLLVRADTGELSLDDLALGEREPGAGGFRRAVVDTLKALRPGYLRDWQGQLADTPANREAEAFARRPVRYRPGANEAIYGYSVPEVAALAAAVGARPWFILPATTTPAQARLFGQMLAVVWRRHRFDEIVVEHGNEHWNAVFRPAGIAHPGTMAAVADRAFAALRDGAGAEVPLHRVLGAQAVRPGAAAQLAKLSQHSEGVAIGPYLLHRQADKLAPEAALDEALSEPADLLRDARQSLALLGRSLDVYEVNLHTLAGDAGAAARDAVVLAPAAGTALARRLLQATLAGVQRQAVYALAGVDTPVIGPAKALVRLFGITRNLAEPAQWRATGLAVAQLNAVASGVAHAADCAGPVCNQLTAVAYAGGQHWAVASGAPTALALSWACSGPQLAGWLDGSQPAGPDSGPAITWQTRRLACTSGQAGLVLPARSLLTVRPAPGR